MQSFHVFISVAVYSCVSLGILVEADAKGVDETNVSAMYTIRGQQDGSENRSMLDANICWDVERGGCNYVNVDCSIV